MFPGANVVSAGGTRLLRAGSSSLVAKPTLSALDTTVLYGLRTGWHQPELRQRRQVVPRRPGLS